MLFLGSKCCCGNSIVCDCNQYPPNDNTIIVSISGIDDTRCSLDGQLGSASWGADYIDPLYANSTTATTEHGAWQFSKTRKHFNGTWRAYKLQSGVYGGGVRLNSNSQPVLGTGSIPNIATTYILCNSGPWEGHIDYDIRGFSNWGANPWNPIGTYDHPFQTLSQLQSTYFWLFHFVKPGDCYPIWFDQFIAKGASGLQINTSYNYPWNRYSYINASGYPDSVIFQEGGIKAYIGMPCFNDYTLCYNTVCSLPYNIGTGLVYPPEVYADPYFCSGVKKVNLIVDTTGSPASPLFPKDTSPYKGCFCDTPYDSGLFTTIDPSCTVFEDMCVECQFLVSGTYMSGNSSVIDQTVVCDVPPVNISLDITSQISPEPYSEYNKTYELLWNGKGWNCIYEFPSDNLDGPYPDRYGYASGSMRRVEIDLLPRIGKREIIRLYYSNNAGLQLVSPSSMYSGYPTNTWTYSGYPILCSGDYVNYYVNVRTYALVGSPAEYTSSQEISFAGYTDCRQRLCHEISSFSVSGLINTAVSNGNWDFWNVYSTPPFPKPSALIIINGNMA